MIRLLWKECREHAWLAVAAVSAPLVTIFVLRVFAQYHRPFPSDATELWITYCIFALWGGTRLPHERAAGRLTLSVLPVKLWQVWLLKITPGLLGAMVSAYLAYSAGHLGYADYGAAYRAEPSLGIWTIAGEMATAYCAAFLVSHYYGAGFSVILGAIVSTFGWEIYWSNLHLVRAYEQGFLWTIVLALAVASAWIMFARARGVSSRWAGLAVVFGLVTIIASISLPYLLRSPNDRAIESMSLAPITPVVSRQSNLASYVTARIESRYETHIGGPKLKVCDLDGSNERTVDSAWQIAPLTWTRDGRLVYLKLEVVASARSQETIYVLPTLRLMMWDAHNEQKRELAAFAEFKFVSNRLLNSAAAEPNGRRLALFLPAQFNLGQSNWSYARDLWLIDLKTTEKRLLWPNVDVYFDVSRLFWRGRRIYWMNAPYMPTKRLHSISPSGGRPRQEAALPIEEGGD